jgi:hypothetical protein
MDDQEYLSVLRAKYPTKVGVDGVLRIKVSGHWRSEASILQRRAEGLRSTPAKRSRARASYHNKAKSTYEYERGRALDNLGGVCLGCGFTDRRALQIDHIDGGGAADRKSFKSATDYYRYIADTKTGYQVLCANCNTIKRIVEGQHRQPMSDDIGADS